MSKETFVVATGKPIYGNLKAIIYFGDSHFPLSQPLCTLPDFAYAYFTIFSVILLR